MDLPGWRLLPTWVQEGPLVLKEAWRSLGYAAGGAFAVIALKVDPTHATWWWIAAVLAVIISVALHRQHALKLGKAEAERYRLDAANWKKSHEALRHDMEIVAKARDQALTDSANITVERDGLRRELMRLARPSADSRMVDTTDDGAVAKILGPTLTEQD